MTVLRLLPLACISCLTAHFTVGCATVADDYHIADGSEQERGYSSVAGNIEVGRSARIGNAKTVAGEIKIGEQSRVGSLSSVAGRIEVGANCRVGGSIKTVAGDIDVAHGCTITGDVGTVAGRVSLTDSVVKRNVTLAAGGLTLTGSRVEGTLRFESPDDAKAEPAQVMVGPNSEVGQVIAEKGAQVHLRIHRTAKVGTIKGVVAEYYD